MTLDQMEARARAARRVAAEAEWMRQQHERGRLDHEWASCVAAFVREFPDLTEYAVREQRPAGFGPLYGADATDITVSVPDREPFSAVMCHDGQAWHFGEFTVPVSYYPDGTPNVFDRTTDPGEALLLAKEATAKRKVRDAQISQRGESNGHAPRVPDCWDRLKDALHEVMIEVAWEQSVQPTEG